MAKRQNAYYDGISEEILRKCQAQINVYEKTLEQLDDEDIRQIYFEDINQLREIIEIAQTDEFLIDDREETLITCKELVEDKINKFLVNEVECGNLEHIELEKFDVKLIVESNEEGTLTFKLVDDREEFEKVLELSNLKDALELLNSYEELTGSPEDKIEVILNSIENSSGENTEETNESAETEKNESFSVPDFDTFDSIPY